MSPDPYDVVEQNWPYDGPYSDEHTTSAATMLDRTVRYLNNATQKADGLRYVATNGRILSGLGSATAGMDQLLSQLSRAIDQSTDDPTVYDDRYDRPASGTCVDLLVVLNEARTSLAATSALLREASNVASHLGQS